eukprot:47761-Eustigmatos_ZCMA.PRE.1
MTSKEAGLLRAVAKLSNCHLSYSLTRIAGASPRHPIHRLHSPQACLSGPYLPAGVKGGRTRPVALLSASRIC